MVPKTRSSGTIRKGHDVMEQVVRDLDDFTIDWELLHEMANTPNKNPGDKNGDIPSLATYAKEKDYYNLSDDDKFEVFLEAMVDDATMKDSAEGGDDESEEDEIIDSTTKKRKSKRVCKNTKTIESDIFDDSDFEPKQGSRRADGMRRDVASRCSSGSKKTTKAKYSLWWTRYVKYSRENDEREDKESTVCHYFHDSLNNRDFGVGSVWSIYACINSGMRTKYGMQMNKWCELRTMLVNITKYYIPKKSDIITKEQFKTLILLCFDPNNPSDLASIITISLMYCGLLRQSEVHEIRVEDVKVSKESDNIYVDFARPTKSRARGFGFMLPTFLTPYFKLYCSQLDRTGKHGKPLKTSQFLKNYNLRSKKRSQNMGKMKHFATLRKIELFLKLTPKSLTSQCWRRSAATELANSGISLLGLKRAG